MGARTRRAANRSHRNDGADTDRVKVRPGPSKRRKADKGSTEEPGVISVARATDSQSRDSRRLPPSVDGPSDSVPSPKSPPSNAGLKKAATTDPPSRKRKRQLEPKQNRAVKQRRRLTPVIANLEADYLPTASPTPAGGTPPSTIESAAVAVTEATQELAATLRESTSLLTPASSSSPLSPVATPPHASRSGSTPAELENPIPSTKPEEAALPVTRRRSARLRDRASPYFPTPTEELTPKPRKRRSSPSTTPSKKPRPPPGTKSANLFPPITNRYFPLLQHRYRHSPFHLLIACSFLNRTKGIHARPVLEKLLAKYPDPPALAAAEFDDVLEIVRTLGLQNRRTGMLIKFARAFVEDPPVRGRRWVVRNYPCKGDGLGLKRDEVLGDEVDGETRGEGAAWEVGHLPGVGAYALDSYRMFARDILRGVAEGYDGEGVEEDEKRKPFEPEWKRVVPLDKELRAWMRWRWLKEGRTFNVETGETREASKELIEQGKVGGVPWDTLDEEAAKEVTVLVNSGRVFEVGKSDTQCVEGEDVKKVKGRSGAGRLLNTP